VTPCTTLLAVVLLLAAGHHAAAQAPGALGGRVVEAGSGAPLAGADVTALGPDTLRVRAGADGRWRIAPLRPGRYKLRARRLGHATRTLVVSVGAGEAAPLTIALTAVPRTLDAQVVTASRRLQRLADVAVATELVSRAEIEATGASDVAAVLVERTGIQLLGGHPNGSGVMLQGLGSERVLVLVDGQPAVGRVSGQLDLSRIPAANVERIEVVKGPQSTMYGSEAMGGVINIVTRAPSEGRLAGSFTATAGSRERRDAAAGVTGGLGPLAIAGDAGRRSIALTPGRSAAEGGLAERWDGALKLRVATGPAAAVEGQGATLTERQQWRIGSRTFFADNAQRTARLGTQWTRGRHTVAPLLYYSEFEHRIRRATGPAPVAGTGERDVQRFGELELAYSGRFGRDALDGGVELRRESIATSNFDDPSSPRVRGGSQRLYSVEPFAQYTLTRGSWTLVPGGRLAWSERWGGQLSPRVAALYRPLPRLALRMAAGRGYRAPEFKELYITFLNTLGGGQSYAVQGNPDLRPETSRNVSVGAEWSGDRLNLRAQLYDNRFRDFIETRAVGTTADRNGDPATLNSYQNVDRGLTRGAELEVGTTWPGGQLETGYAYLRTRDLRTGTPLLYSPAHSGRASVTQGVRGGLRGTLSAVHTGRTPVERAADGTIALTREAFTRVDLRLARRFPRDVELVAGADNLFGRTIDAWPGFAGRQIYAGVQWGRR